MQAAQQHDLKPAIAKRIVHEVRVAAGETVVEVGAGKGAITRELLAAGATVHALERDAARIATLRTTFAAEIADGRLHLWPGDALLWKQELPAGWRVVANPPFNLTAVLLRRWLVEERSPPAAIDLVLQREAALKLSPKPGEQTRSSVLVALSGRAAVRLALQRDATTPPSRVDLCLWCFRRGDEPPTPDEMVAVDRLLAKGFAGPHTVIDALRGLATGLQVRRQAVEHGWNPAAHPRRLAPGAWLAFAKLLVMCHKL